MAVKNIAEVAIGGRVIKISGYESPEYLHQIAAYINQKTEEFEKMEGYSRQSAEQKQLLMYLNLADDYFKSRRTAESQKAELEQKEKEMYSLKHDLVESRLALENAEKAAREAMQAQKKDAHEELEMKDRVSKARIEELELQLQNMKEQLSRKEAEAGQGGVPSRNAGNYGRQNNRDPYNDRSRRGNPGDGQITLKF